MAVAGLQRVSLEKTEKQIFDSVRSFTFRTFSVNSGLGNGGDDEMQSPIFSFPATGMPDGSSSPCSLQKLLFFPKPSVIVSLSMLHWYLRKCVITIKRFSIGH